MHIVRYLYPGHHEHTCGTSYKTLSLSQALQNCSVSDRLEVRSWIPSLVPIPVVGIPMGYEQGGRAKVRATQAMAQHA